MRNGANWIAQQLKTLGDPELIELRIALHQWPETKARAQFDELIDDEWARRFDEEEDLDRAYRSRIQIG